MEYSRYDAKVVESKAYANADCKNDCKAAVLKSDSLPAAENYPWYGGDYKIPKVLAEFVVQIDTESKIKLAEPAYEIKRIEKQVFLTQCRYIPPTDKVFIEGYIRANIEYAARKCTSKHSAISGSIKDTTVHVPFKVYTKVDFNGNPPIVLPNTPPMVAKYFDQKRMGKNFREADRSNIEVFNEPVYCELEWSAIYDAEINDYGTPIDGMPNEEEFSEFTDKSVVYICMKLLQKQQVYMPGPKPCPKEEKTPNPIHTEWNVPINDILKKKY